MIEHKFTDLERLGCLQKIGVVALFGVVCNAFSCARSIFGSGHDHSERSLMVLQARPGVETNEICHLKFHLGDACHCLSLSDQAIEQLPAEASEGLRSELIVSLWSGHM